MAEETDDTESPKAAASTSWLRTFTTELVTVGTLLVSILTAVVSAKTQGVVESSAHAQAVTAQFTQNVDKLTQSFTKHDREDEEAADVTLTALEDLAQTPDDQIAIMTIAARMLNPTACRSNGEATARFLTTQVTRLKLQRTNDARTVLAFARSRAFLDLAASDITVAYYVDDSIQETDMCSDPSLQPVSSPVPVSYARAQPVPSTTPAPTAPMLRRIALAKLRKVRDTPDNGDSRNHATYWGEQTVWNGAKTALFRELRPDGYAGWIHVATWEREDTCVDARGTARSGPELECGSPIAVDYTSIGVPRAAGDTSLVGKAFWLGRARFLRDAAPRTYVHPGDSTMRQRGALGHVIGVVEAGECVVADAMRSYAVSPLPDRAFEHVWVHVRAADDARCGIVQPS